jgi:hypothetical protein
MPNLALQMPKLSAENICHAFDVPLGQKMERVFRE